MTQTEVVVAGRPIRLGQSIGRGGEGEVFALGDQSGRAVKLYNSAKRATRESKVMAMVQAKLANRSTFVAYPIDVARYRNGEFAGFVMKLVNGCQPLFELYSPGARKLSFPKADYRFLVRSAANISRAVASVHSSGCVIGDINHSGILVSDKAMVTLIDADSFQVIDGQSRYLCRVGVPEYTPPELHGINLGSVLRTTNHDAFGLAVVIFQLLFLGRHPFVGTVRSGDVPKIDHAIRDFRFVYAENRNVGMDQPPGTPALSDFTSRIGESFDRAFSKASQTQRPSANSWVRSLAGLEKALISCNTNSLHFFPRESSQCPWCFMDQELGMSLFVPYFDAGEANGEIRDPGETVFNLAAVWRQIEAVKVPPRSGLKPRLQTVSFKPTQEALDAKSGSGTQRFMGFLGAGAAAGIVFTAPSFWFVWIPLGWWGLKALFGEPEVRAYPFVEKFKEVELQWQQSYAEWRQRTGVQDLRDLQFELEASRTKYATLAQEEQSRISNYKQKRSEIQLARYLDGFQIHRARIRGIGPAKEATLASFGIETAADINWAKILSLPGFGPTNSKPLLDWRKSKERRFVYDAKPNAVDKQEIAKIRGDIANQRTQARQLLVSGPNRLRRLLRRVRTSASVVDSKLNTIHKRREQIRADLNYLGISEPKITPTSGPARPSRSTYRPTAKIPSSSSSTTSSAAPTCPRCSARMAMRLARRGRFAGKHFWGCSRYPTCKGIVNI